MDKNRISISDDEFDDSQIKSGNCNVKNSVAYDELGIDTLDVTLDASEEWSTVFQPADAEAMHDSKDALYTIRPYYRAIGRNPDAYAYGEPTYFYHNNELIGKFYKKSVKRTGKYEFKLSCISSMGLLDVSTHYGGLYTGQRFQDVLRDIIGEITAYEIDTPLNGIPVYGWLPVATRRENLQQLLFAVGAGVKKNSAGELFFTAINAGSQFPISDDRQFLGGAIDFPAYATRAEVTEHAYINYAGDEVVTLFEGDVVAEPIVTPGGAALNGFLVTFDSPIHNLQVSAGGILESGVNYAVLATAIGCKLTGQKYTHTTHIVTANKAQNTRASMGTVQDKTVRVTNATLVSIANSETIAKRVLSYYGSARTVKADIVVGPERPGDAVSLTDPFGNPTSGMLRSLDIKISGVLRASAEIIAGYVPVESGNFYENSYTVLQSGGWTVPAGVKKIRVVLIGGGQGGYSGSAGKPGEKGQLVSLPKPGSLTLTDFTETGREHSEGYCGDGGEGGAGGHGGRTYIFTMDVTPGQVIQFSIGAGGAGGSPSGSSTVHNAGAEGGATTCNGYSSDSGSYSLHGYTNIFNGEVFGQSGGVGIRGGRGAGPTKSGAEYLSGPTVSINGATYVQGASASGDVYTDEITINGGGKYRDTIRASSGGGPGGGAAAGSNGNKGSRSSVSVSRENATAYIGYGGRGATPSIVPNAPTIPGTGGFGGHGGGGGGAAGYGAVLFLKSTGSNSSTPSLNVLGDGGGLGGNGGMGGPGAPGCAIIYY